MMGLVDVFPKRVNGWKGKGWRDRVLWGFLGELDGGKVEDGKKVCR